LIYPAKEVKAHGARRLINGDFQEGEAWWWSDDSLITAWQCVDGHQQGWNRPDWW